MAAAAATHMAVAGTFHFPDGYQRGAVDRLDSDRVAVRSAPSPDIHLEMQGRQFAQQPKHAIDRAQVLAPDPLFTAIKITYPHGCQCGSTEDQQDSLRILVHGDHLAVNRRANKSHKRPTTPSHPARNGPVTSFAAYPFGQCPFRTEHAAPSPSHKHHA